MFEVEVAAGRGEPLPDYVSIVLDAQWWGVSPMELETWPLAWIQRGQIVRTAQNRAQEKLQQRSP